MRPSTWRHFASCPVGALTKGTEAQTRKGSSAGAVAGRACSPQGDSALCLVQCLRNILRHRFPQYGAAIVVLGTPGSGAEGTTERAGNTSRPHYPPVPVTLSENSDT